VPKVDEKALAVRCREVPCTNKCVHASPGSSCEPSHAGVRNGVRRTPLSFTDASTVSPPVSSTSLAILGDGGGILKNVAIVVLGARSGRGRERSADR
jgi:hypothetical protein